MNNVNLIGRMTKDSEAKQTTNGKFYNSFCIAVDAGKDRVYFIDCIAWDKTAQNIQAYFRKGDKIGVSGILTTRSWEDSEGKNRKATEVLVMSFDFCNGKPSEKAEQPEEEKKEEEPEEEPEEEKEHDKLPFEI